MRALSIYGSAALVNLGRFFSFLILYIVGRAPWTGDKPAATYKQNNTNAE
jgi:hypothetical protein